MHRASPRLFIYTLSPILNVNLWIPRMRILVLSDLHANVTALDAVLEAAQGRWEQSVCLGDVVGYGPDPNEVTARLRKLGTQTIRGNHDKAVAGVMPTDDFNLVAKAAVDWTRAQLTPEHLSWLAALPPGPLATDGIVLVHGAFQDEDEYVFTPAQALDGLLDSGSIGQPRDGDPRAAFAIADLDHQTIEFWRVPYDISSVQERMRQARLPEPLVQRLMLGR